MISSPVCCLPTELVTIFVKDEAKELSKNDSHTDNQA